MMADDAEIDSVDLTVLDRIPGTWKILFSGGVAGCVAKTATAPLSRIVILYQASAHAHSHAQRIKNIYCVYWNVCFRAHTPPCVVLGSALP
jgi:hypothetical protein